MIPAEEVYEVAVDLLRKKGSTYEGTLRSLIEWEEENDYYYDDLSPTGHSWESKNVPVTPAKISYLVRIGLIHIVHSTNKYKVFCLSHPAEILKALEPMAHAREISEVPGAQLSEIDTDNLFQWIVGYDDVKYWVKKAITGPKPVHIALDGPPATAKSAFLLDLSRLPGCIYTTGTKMTNSGLFELLMYEQPKILCIDEFEKLAKDAFNTLYTLLADGFIKKDQHGDHIFLELDTRVITSTNEWRRVPEPIQSRLLLLEFNEYTEEEYEEIVPAMLPELEGTDPELATYIAKVTGQFTRDIRESIRYSRLCENMDEVDKLFETQMKWRRSR